MTANEQRAALQRLSRLRRVRRLASVTAIVTAVASYFLGAEKAGAVWPGGLLAAILLWMLSAIVIERFARRTRCPECREPFFQDPMALGSRWQAQENCARCRFNLYRGGNIQ
jgi:hypothetical protein